MKALRSLRARATLALGAVTLLVSLGVLGTVGALRTLGGAIDTILRENYASVRACERMSDALERTDSAVLITALGGPTAGGALASIPSLRDEFARALRFEERNVTLPGEDRAARDLRAAWTAYSRALDATLGQPEGLRAATYAGALLPNTERVRTALFRVLSINHARMEQADHEARALAQRTVRWAVVLGAVCVLLALWALRSLPRSLVQPLEALAGTARAVGRGELTVTVPEPNLGELDPLATALRTMVAHLRAYRESSLGELLAARDLAQATVECLLDPVLVLEPDGGVSLANAAAERAFGLREGSAEELRRAGVSLPEAILAARDHVLTQHEPLRVRSLADAFAFAAAHERAARSAPDGARDENSPTGARHFLVRAAPLRSEGSDRPRVLVVAEDVTRLKRIDDMKSDVVATVSHEFKTPLTSLRMATHLLLEPATGPLTEAQRELCVTARDDTERLRAMVDALLDLVRIESEAGGLRSTELDPWALLRESVEAQKILARDKGVALVVAPGDAGLRVEGDAEKLAIVLANLTANALRHTAAGGTVTLSCARGGPGPEGEGTVLLRVRDDGEGMSAETLGSIFSRDRRAVGPGGAGSRDRHGLGLSIAREIVVQHGGSLRVESAPGVGSTFVVALPERARGGYTSAR